MTPAELEALRKSMDLTQIEMAEAMGLSLRAYTNAERGTGDVRRLYQLAVERLAMSFAAGAEDPMIAPASVRSDALKIAKTITGN